MLKGCGKHLRFVLLTYVVFSFILVLGMLAGYGYLTVVGFSKSGQDSVYEYTVLQWSLNAGSRKWLSLCGLISCFVHLGICCCPFIAEFRKSPRWYTPWIIYTIFSLVALYLSFVLRMVVMLEEGENNVLSILVICLGTVMVHSVLVISKRRKEDIELEVIGLSQDYPPGVTGVLV